MSNPLAEARAAGAEVGKLAIAEQLKVMTPDQLRDSAHCTLIIQRAVEAYQGKRAELIDQGYSAEAADAWLAAAIGVFTTEFRISRNLVGPPPAAPFPPPAA